MQFCKRPLIANINPMQIYKRPLTVNISPMQICIRQMSANIDKENAFRQCSEGSRRICVKCALMGDDSRRESPRRALASDCTRMLIGELLLRVAFVANAPTTLHLGVAPRRGAPTTLPRSFACEH